MLCEKPAKEHAAKEHASQDFWTLSHRFYPRKEEWIDGFKGQYRECKSCKPQFFFCKKKGLALSLVQAFGNILET